MNMTLGKPSLEELKRIVQGLQIAGKKVVFTNGCFDILHPGHIRLLTTAKSFGDVIIVGVNTDVSVKMFKGDKRPILSQDERLEMISALKPVDFAILFGEREPSKIIAELKPDIHVKGGDYNPEDYASMPEAKVVHEYGGVVKIVKIVEGKSTTNIIKKINEAYSGQ